MIRSKATVLDHLVLFFAFLALLALGLWSCAPTDHLTGRDAQALERYDGLGAQCDHAVGCDPPLACRLHDAPTPECGWPRPSSGCPEGYVQDTAVDATVGPVDLGGPLQVTGVWCVPTCDGPTDCPLTQCCVGATARQRGLCLTHNSHQEYLVSEVCRP